MIFDFEICFLICFFFFLCRHNLQPFFAFFCWRRVQSGQPPLHLEYIGGVFCIYKVCVISSFNSLHAEKYKLHSMHWTVINGRRHRPREWHVVICIHQTNKQQATEPPNRRQYTDLNGHCTGFTEKTHTISYLFTQIQQLSFFINIFFVSVLFVLHNDMAKPVCRSRRTAKMNNKEKKK